MSMDNNRGSFPILACFLLVGNTYVRAQAAPEDLPPAKLRVAFVVPDARPLAAATNATIFSDDFAEAADRSARYFEYNPEKGSFVWKPGEGMGAQRGAMRAQFERGQVEAGSLKVLFGKSPFSKGIRSQETFREIYWRVYVKHEAGWSGNPAKLARATCLASPEWSQGFIAHVWGGKGDVLCIDPATGIQDSRKVSTRYNDFAHLHWLGYRQTQTPICSAAESGRWVCIESHIRLNTPGRKDGVFELWIDGKLEAARRPRLARRMERLRYRCSISGELLERRCGEARGALVQRLRHQHPAHRPDHRRRTTDVHMYGAEHRALGSAGRGRSGRERHCLDLRNSYGSGQHADHRRGARYVYRQPSGTALSGDGAYLLAAPAADSRTACRFWELDQLDCMACAFSGEAIGAAKEHLNTSSLLPALPRMKPTRCVKSNAPFPIREGSQDGWARNGANYYRRSTSFWTAAVSSSTLGPMVEESLMRRRYLPFAAAGLALTRAPSSATKLAWRFSVG